jgi:hypothetical protein
VQRSTGTEEGWVALVHEWGQEGHQRRGVAGGIGVVQVRWRELERVS